MKLLSPFLAFSSLVVLAAGDSNDTGSSSIAASTVIIDNNGPRSSSNSSSFKRKSENMYPPKELNSSRRINSKGKKKEKDSDKEPLYAEIKTRDKDGDYPDMEGWVTVEYNDNDKLVIDYSIKEGPKRCRECVLAIYSGKSCSKLDKSYHDMEINPWSKDEKALYITNKNRRAAGHFKTENGYSYKKNECKFIVLLDKDDGRRRLAGKGSKDKGPKKIACGQLIPESKPKDHCEDD